MGFVSGEPFGGEIVDTKGIDDEALRGQQSQNGSVTNTHGLGNHEVYSDGICLIRQCTRNEKPHVLASPRTQ